MDQTFEILRKASLCLADIVSDGYAGMFKTKSVLGEPEPEALAKGRAAEPALYALLRFLKEYDPNHYYPRVGDRVRHRQRAEPGYADITLHGLLTDEGLPIARVDGGEDGSGFYTIGFQVENGMHFFTSPYLELVARAETGE